MWPHGPHDSDLLRNKQSNSSYYCQSVLTETWGPNFFIFSFAILSPLLQFLSLLSQFSSSLLQFLSSLSQFSSSLLQFLSSLLQFIFSSSRLQLYKFPIYIFWVVEARWPIARYGKLVFWLFNTNVSSFSNFFSNFDFSIEFEN